MEDRDKHQLFTEDQLKNRIDARDRNKHTKFRALCLHCRTPIPETKQFTAKYCSIRCCNRHRYEKIDELRVEIRTTVRELKAIKRCINCSKLINKTRLGRIATRCTTCRDRERQRIYRAKKKGVLSG